MGLQISVSSAAVKDKKLEKHIKASRELHGQIDLMENIAIKAAAVNPANLISAILKTPEDELICALPTLHQLTELLEGTPLGMFLYNLKIVVTDSDPYLWQSVIESYPEFIGSITEVGGKLADLAITKADQLTIFNEEEMGLNNLFPKADVFSEDDSFFQPGQDKTKIKEIVSDNVGQTAGTSKKRGKSKNAN